MEFLLSYYLGIEVQQNNDGIILKQTSYTRKILQQANMLDCNASRYPMEAKLHLGKEREGTLVNAIEYQHLIGNLIYLTHT